MMLFFQINMTDQKEFQGLGIGLTVASELTKLLKGRISVQSELNVGTTMTVELKFPPSKPLSYKETASLSVLIFSNGNPSLIKPLFESLDLNLYDESNIDNNKVDVIIFEAPIRLNETIIQFKELYGHDDCMTYSIRTNE